MGLLKLDLPRVQALSVRTLGRSALRRSLREILCIDFQGLKVRHPGPRMFSPRQPSLVAASGSQLVRKKTVLADACKIFCLILRSQDDAAAQQVGPDKKAAKAKQDRAAAAADRAAAREVAAEEAKRRAELELLLMDEDSLRQPAPQQPGERPRYWCSASRPASRLPSPAAQNARFVINYLWCSTKERVPAEFARPRCSA